MSIDRIKAKRDLLRTAVAAVLGLLLFTGMVMSPAMTAAQPDETTETSAAVLHMETQGIDMTPEAAGNLLRMELEKLDHYMVLDRYETQDILQQHDIQMEACYGRSCLLEAGEALDVDKVISGTAEHFGNRIVITIRQVDVASGEIGNSVVTEYLDIEEELARMIRFNVKELAGISIEEDEREPLLHVDPPITGELKWSAMTGQFFEDY